MLRHTILSFIAILLIASSVVFADTIDGAMIQKVHTNTVSSFILHCKKEMIGTSDETCRCLAEKAQAYLNDAELAKCQNNESGISCISTAVSDATSKALTPENLKACNYHTVYNETAPNADTSDDFSSDAAANTSTDASTTDKSQNVSGN